MSNPRPACPRCGAEGDWLPCNRCVGKVLADLRLVPGYAHELQVTITGQGVMGAGGKSNERPMPYREKAVKAATYVHNQLTTWVRELSMGDDVGLANNARALSRWLADRIERIRGHAAFDEIADEIAYCCQIMRQLIDRPVDMIFCGKCEVCGGENYAQKGKAQATCRRCKSVGVETVYEPAARREWLLSQVEEQQATVAMCATLLATFGLEVKASTIQNWAAPTYREVAGERKVAHPPKLWKVGENTQGHALYRVGDIADLIHESIRRKSERKRKVAA